MEKNYRLSYAILFLYMVCLSTFINVVTQLPYLFVYLFIFVSLLLFGFILNEISLLKYAVLYIIIFFLKNLLLVYQSLYRNLPMGGEDWLYFDFMARKILLSTNSTKEILLEPDQELFSKIVAIFYKYVIADSLIIYYIVFLFSLIMLLYFIKNLKLWNISLNTINYFAILLFALPIEFIFSITFLREIPIQMFIVIGLYFFSKFILNKSLFSFIFAIIFFSFASMMHAGLIGLVLLSFLWILPVMKNRKLNINLFRVLFSLIFFLILIKSGMLDSLMLKFSSIDNIENLQNVTLNVKVRGNTSYIYPTTNIVDYLLSIPYRVIMFTLSPFPWQFKSVGIIIAFFIDGVYRYYFFYKMITEFKYKEWNNFNNNEKKYLVFLIVTWLITTLIFALGTQTTGTAMRHRAKLYPLEFIILALYEYKNE